VLRKSLLLRFVQSKEMHSNWYKKSPVNKNIYYAIAYSNPWQKIEHGSFDNSLNIIKIILCSSEGDYLVWVKLVIRQVISDQF